MSDRNTALQRLATAVDRLELALENRAPDAGQDAYSPEVEQITADLKGMRAERDRLAAEKAALARSQAELSDGLDRAIARLAQVLDTEETKVAAR